VSAVAAPPTDPEARGTSQGIRVALAAYIIWGLLTVYWKQLHRFNAFELIGWRIVSATAVMALVITANTRWGVIRGVFTSRALAGRVVLAATLLAANWSAYMYAIVHDHVIETALGYFMAPLGTMTLGIVVLGERPTRIQKLAMASGAAAVVIFTVASGRPPIAALVIAVSWSLYALLKRRVTLSGIESFAAETFVLFVPAVIAIGLAAPSSSSIPHSADAIELTLVALSGVATAVPLVLFAFAAARVPFTILGPMQYLVPTINFLLGWLFYDEALPWPQLVGFGFVWLALVLVTYERVHATISSRRTDALAAKAAASVM
jgi:chloramphenicol-sensitive protein RarD